MEVDVAAMLALALKIECSRMVGHVGKISFAENLDEINTMFNQLTHYFWQVGVVPISNFTYSLQLYSLWCCNCISFQ